MRVEEPAAASRAAAETSVGEVLRRSARDLDKILASFRIPPEDAEDLLQNLALQFLRKRAHIRAPRSWLRGALRNECRMYWRTRSRRLTVAVDESILTLLAGPAGDDPERVAMRRGLLRYIAALSNTCRSLLRMRYSLGMNVTETAERTRYKPSSIDKVTRRCVEELGRKLAAAAGARRGARA